MMTCPHCGRTIIRGRSDADHRRFFAIIHRAFESWPESHEFTPDNAEHLRAWLLCKARYRESQTIMLPDEATDAMVDLFRLGIEAALKAAGAHAFVVPYGSGVAVIRPKSLKYSAAGQSTFAAVRAAVEDVLAAELGDAFLEEQDHHAHQDRTRQGDEKHQRPEPARRHA